TRGRAVSPMVAHDPVHVKRRATLSGTHFLDDGQEILRVEVPLAGAERAGSGGSRLIVCLHASII
ncbi:MAG TPA: hypothetical protein VM537_32275, partial [Anaerolineae bacterium]|nr:hypothetical protein [Anaerolineae bacterium]